MKPTLKQVIAGFFCLACLTMSWVATFEAHNATKTIFYMGFALFFYLEFRRRNP